MKLPSRRQWNRLVLGFLMAVFAIQLVPELVATTSYPPIVREPSWDSAATHLLAKQACFDCHSNET